MYPRNAQTISNQKKEIEKPASSLFGSLDLDSVVSGLKTNLSTGKQNGVEKKVETILETDAKTSPAKVEEILSEPVDDELVINLPTTNIENVKDQPLKPMSEIIIDIDSIQPGSEQPRTIMDDKDGLTIVLQFAKDRPRPDVSVIVITTTNQNSNQISDYEFNASVSKV